jgi:hypothetical protein
MKVIKFLFIFFFIYAFSSKAFAYNMISLNDFFKKHSPTDKVAQVYAFERCSALFLYYSSLVNEKDKILYVTIALELNQKATDLHSKVYKKNIKDSENKVLENVDKIFKFYEKDGNTIFIKSGTKFGDYISLDTDFCLTLHSAWFRR